MIKLHLPEIDVIIINQLLLEASHKRRSTNPQASLQFMWLQRRLVQQLNDQTKKHTNGKIRIFKRDDGRWVVWDPRMPNAVWSFASWNLAAKHVWS